MSVLVGEIKYSNMLPFFFYLDRFSLSKLGIKFLPQTPSMLNDAMSRGNIQMGAISSFSYGEHFNDYSVFPHMSVSSTECVGSIYLFSKLPLKRLNKKKVALTSSSATSVNLLKIILRVFYDLDVTYSVVPPNLLRMMQDHDACLLIGDDAIVAFWNYAKQFYCYDIGKLWYQHTKYPMTYALFAVRNELLTNRTVIQALFEQFQMSKKKSIETGFKELIKPIRSIIGGKTRYWLNYFQGLNYDFSDEHQEGLSHYFDLAKQLGLLRKVDKMIIWDYKHYHSLK